MDRGTDGESQRDAQRDSQRSKERDSQSQREKETYFHFCSLSRIKRLLIMLFATNDEAKDTRML